MTGGETTAIGRGARWLLLVATLFGLATMHTLGHAGMRMDAPHAHPAVVGSASPAAMPAHCPDGDCGGGAMSGWSVCLAVLGALAVLVLLLVALFGLRRRDPARSGVEVAAAGAPRAPPLRIMSSTAVLRI